MISFSPLSMPVSPDIKRFSINKEDVPEGKMRVLHSGVHNLFAPAYLRAANEFEQQFPGQIRVEEAVIEAEDGTRLHPRDQQTVISPNQTVIFIETPVNLYQPLIARTGKLKQNLLDAENRRREELRQQILAAHRIATELTPQGMSPNGIVYSHTPELVGAGNRG